MRAIAGICLLTVLLSSRLAQAQPPTVVELFQSQGCSSCPPAIRNVNALADRSDTLVLMFAVTYWDRLGWKDTFARPEFTRRQYDYGRMLRTGAYTPEVVINGRADLVGIDGGELTKAVAKAAPLPGPAIQVTDNMISVGVAGISGAADVWLVRYDSGPLNVDIGAGENSGVMIAHRNVVRSLSKLGSWRGAAARYPVPASADPRLKSAVLIQGENGGAILSAARL